MGSGSAQELLIADTSYIVFPKKYCVPWKVNLHELCCYCFIADLLMERKKLSCTESYHWSTQPSIVYTDWQIRPTESSGH